jgi:hypothetical protein
MKSNSVECELRVMNPQPTITNMTPGQRYPHLISQMIATFVLAAVALAAGWFCLDTFSPNRLAHGARISHLSEASLPTDGAITTVCATDDARCL